jgi:hypothetical protein
MLYKVHTPFGIKGSPSRLVYEVWEPCHVTHVVTFRQMQYFILNILYISLCIPEVVQHTFAGAFGHTNGVIVCGNKAKETEKMGAGGMSAEPACMCLPIVDGLPDGSSDVPGLIAPPSIACGLSLPQISHTSGNRTVHEHRLAFHSRSRCRQISPSELR